MWKLLGGHLLSLEAFLAGGQRLRGANGGLGSVLKVFWAYLETFRAVLEASWRLLGGHWTVSRKRFGRSWRVLDSALGRP